MGCNYSVAEEYIDYAWDNGENIWIAFGYITDHLELDAEEIKDLVDHCHFLVHA